ncbi:MAG: response regulator [Gemmatimonadaceae bacterium]
MSRSLRILVVDDNVGILESMTLSLRFLGHQVASAADGATALHQLQEDLPDVVFLDLSMPGMSGLDVVTQARSLPRQRDVTFIALSGRAAESDREVALATGFDLHVVKPLDLEQLKHVLDQVGDDPRAD